MTPADLDKRAKEREAKLKADFTALAQAGKVDDLVTLATEMVSKALRENDRLVWERAMSRFPKTSEKVSGKQLALALQALTEARPDKGDDAPSEADQATDKLVDEVAEELARAKEAQKDAAAANRKKGHGRRQPSDDLPRQMVKVPVPDQLRACPCCGGERVCIGYESSEILELVPAHFVVLGQMREKLACPTCKEGVVTAANQKLVDRLMAGPQLLAHLVVSKYEDHLPLYRLERFYARLGQPIARSTLAGWSGVAADALEPIVDEMWKDLHGAFLVHADGTGIRVLDRDAPDGRRVGTMWAHVGQDLEQRVVVFKYAPDATGDNGPWKYLAGRKGYTLTDASNTFDRLYNGRVASADEVGCYGHGRRRFVEILDCDKRAAIPIKLIASLYMLERLADLQGLSDEKRLAMRKDKSKRVVDRLFKWCVSVRPTPGCRRARSVSSSGGVERSVSSQLQPSLDRRASWPCSSRRG